MNKIFLILLLSFFSSCSGNLKKEGMNYNRNFQMTDGQGKYEINQKVYLKKNNIITKYRLNGINDEGIEKILEKNDIISLIGKLKNGPRVLRPRYSKFNIWIDKKKYSSIIKINLKTKKYDVTSKIANKEEKKESVSIPKKNNGLFCFYSQIIECMKINKFISKAIDNKGGKAKLHIVWDGYPYRQEIYEKIPEELFTNAEFQYDGIKKNGNFDFALHFGNQAISYHLDSELRLTNMFWINQGISIVRKR